MLNGVTLLVASGVGISVREGATLRMKDCVIRGATSAALVMHPNSTLDIGEDGSGVSYVECATDVVKTATLGHLTAISAALNADTE